MGPDRQVVMYGAGAVALMALLLVLVSHRTLVGVLFVCAVVAGGLVANVYDSRELGVDALWHFLSPRRPDLTHERLGTYVVAWCLVILVAFAIVLWQLMSGT